MQIYSTAGEDEWFQKGMDRNNRLKGKRDEPNTNTLLNYGIKLNTKKKMRTECTVGRSSIDKEVAKFIARSIACGQMRINNKGLQPFSLHDKPSFNDLCQTLVYAGAKTGINFDVKDFLLSGHRRAEKNIDEYREVFKEKQPEVKRAAFRKCVNIQPDMWSKNSVSVLGVNASYWKHPFENDCWEYTNTALGIHNFDELLREPNETEVVHKHTALEIKNATDELLGIHM